MIRSTKTLSFFYIFGSFAGKSFHLMTIAHKFMFRLSKLNFYQVDGREFPEAASCMKCYL